MKINRTQLKQAVEQLLPGTDSGTYIQGCDTIVFSDSTVSSYNDRISASVPNQSGLRGAVKAQEFFKIISKLKGEEIEIEQLETSWKITAGNTEVEIMLCESVIAEYINNFKLSELTFQDLPENYIEGVRLCSIPGNSFYLQGIISSSDMLISTDNIRLNFFKLKNAMETFWLREDAVSFLLSIKEKITQYVQTDSWIHFKGDSGTVFSTIKSDDASYPSGKLLEFSNQFVQVPSDPANMFPKEFAEVMERVGVLSIEAGGFYPVDLHMTKNNFIVSSKNDVGKIKETVKLENPFAGDLDIKFSSDWNFLKNAFKKCPTFYIRKEGADTHFVFYNDNFKQVVRGRINE